MTVQHVKHWLIALGAGAVLMTTGCGESDDGGGNTAINNNQAPTVSALGGLTSPVFEDTIQSGSFSANDADGDTVTKSLQYSTDNGSTWTSSPLTLPGFNYSGVGGLANNGAVLVRGKADDGKGGVRFTTIVTITIHANRTSAQAAMLDIAAIDSDLLNFSIPQIAQGFHYDFHGQKAGPTDFHIHYHGTLDSQDITDLRSDTGLGNTLTIIPPGTKATIASQFTALIKP